MKKTHNKTISIAMSILLILSVSCSNEPDRAMVISKLKNSAKLATVEYVVSKVISAKDKNWFAKDAYFFAETQATIKAGIDLEKLREDDVKITGKRITIKLPPVEIVNFSYPAEGFKVITKYTDDAAILKWNSIRIEQKDELYRQGEADIRSNIKNLGIIKTAQTNARILLKKILQLSGFEEIYIEFKSNNGELLTQDKQLLNDLKEFLSNSKK